MEKTCQPRSYETVCAENVANHVQNVSSCDMTFNSVAKVMEGYGDTKSECFVSDRIIVEMFLHESSL